jgi:hypothetical protein
MSRMQQVLLLRVELPFELEKCNHTIGRIITALKRPMWKCMHGKRTIAFVIITHESSLELVKRLGLYSMDDIDNFWCHVAPIGIIAKNGVLDTLDTAIDKAWEHAGKRHNPEYMRQTQRLDPLVVRRVKDGMGSASIEMRVKPRGMRDEPQNPDRK